MSKIIISWTIFSRFLYYSIFPLSLPDVTCLLLPPNICIKHFNTFCAVSNFPDYATSVLNRFYLLNLVSFLSKMPELYFSNMLILKLLGSFNVNSTRHRNPPSGILTKLRVYVTPTLVRNYAKYFFPKPHSFVYRRDQKFKISPLLTIF